MLLSDAILYQSTLKPKAMRSRYGHAHPPRLKSWVSLVKVINYICYFIMLSL